MEKPLFKPGRIIATAAANGAMKEAGQDPRALLDRHVSGDWGKVSEDVRQANCLSARTVFNNKRPRIFSAYTLQTNVKVWLITEADRSVTTFLLPEEYRMAGTNVIGKFTVIDDSGTRKLKE